MHQLRTNLLFLCACLFFFCLQGQEAQAQKKPSAEKSNGMFSDPEIEIPIVHRTKNDGAFRNLLDFFHTLMSESKEFKVAVAEQVARVSEEMNQHKAKSAKNLTHPSEKKQP